MHSDESTPILFLAHGAPLLLDDDEWMSQLARWSNALARPRAILVISAHWQEDVVTLGAVEPTPLVYDFYGFPEKYYATQYSTPPPAALAEEIKGILTDLRMPVRQQQRGLDHGAYVPLVAMYPNADIPVLQVSLPRLAPDDLLNAGRAFSRLRKSGVLIVASGFLTHNMSYAFRPGIPNWAVDFDAFCADALQRFDVDALAGFRERSPAAALAHPTWEHYAPLLVAVGAAAEGSHNASFPIEGWWMNSAFSKRSVQLT